MENTKEEYMVKKILLLRYGLLLIVFIVLTAGCSNQHRDKNDTEIDSNGNDNPFEVDEEETIILGNLGHGFANPEVDENGEMLPLHYDGG
ncbi:hypothetical protein SAMN05421736_1342 [Evansella caseinilytica]|uniref:Uncharacterized protein n=1 Tax=Evansella caseinilytica TaxID=1503961 RepID=A0A1H3V124_9BACI|nr:hypothetical protein [Evansella caseinilytica]SDZ68317.1 hypothetical protein SAMN05421736_1342 [Evansella caseinilytica]